MVRADPDQPILTDGGREGWYPCDLCGAQYRNAQAAMDCCSDRLPAIDRGKGIETDGGTDVEDPGDFEPASEPDAGDEETFYQAVCLECGSEKHDAWSDRPHLRESFAKIALETHRQISGCGSGHVRTFTSEPIGSLPRERPPIEADDGGEE
jgi:hypothetical protein